MQNVAGPGCKGCLLYSIINVNVLHQGQNFYLFFSQRSAPPDLAPWASASQSVVRGPLVVRERPLVVREYIGKM